MLASATGDALQTTHHQHFSVGGDRQGWFGLSNSLNASADGNTVESSVEQAQFGAAAAQYQATLDFLNNRVSGLRRAFERMSRRDLSGFDIAGTALNAVRTHEHHCLQFGERWLEASSEAEAFAEVGGV